MTMKDIIQRHALLERQLQYALATMEKKETIHDLRIQLIDLQSQCPHMSDEYNFTWVDNECPYCGKKIDR